MADQQPPTPESSPVDGGPQPDPSPSYFTQPHPSPAGPEPVAHPSYAGAASAAATRTATAERVGLGLLASLGAVVAGTVLSVVLWRLGFIAGISSFVIAAGAAVLYTRGAGAEPRRGVAPLLVVIIAGVAVSFLAVVASDLFDVYDELAIAGADVSRVRFVADNLFNADVLSAYGRDMAFFALFAVLGMFRTVRTLFAGLG